MLQRGNSDAAKRLRKSKAPPVAPKRERANTVDPAQLHEQAVVAAVRAHEIAYGIARPSMEDSRKRPSIERQGSHISRHLSNASAKARPARPRPARTSTAVARLETTSLSASNYPEPSLPFTSDFHQLTTPVPGNMFASVDKHKTEQSSIQTTPLSAKPSRNKLRKKASNVANVVASSPAPPVEYDPSRHVYDTLTLQSEARRREKDIRHVDRQPQADSVATTSTGRVIEQNQHGQRLRESPSMSALSFTGRGSRIEKDKFGSLKALKSQDSFQAQIEAAKKEAKKSRRISVSFTSTLKRAFGRKSSATIELPPQQVQAHRAHYGSGSTTKSRETSTSTSFTAGEYGTTPPVPSTYLSDMVMHQTGSLSSTSDAYTRSRVTSWMTDSSKEYTTRIRDMEPQLPIIEETPRNTSQAASVHQDEANLYDFDIRDVDITGTSRQTSQTNDRNKVDSKRLLSALRAHIGDDCRNQQRSEEVRTVSKSSGQSWQSSVKTPIRQNKRESEQDEQIQMSASIRDFAEPEFPFDMSFVEDEAEKHEPAHDRMLSPSIYSERPGVHEKLPQDSAISLPERAATPPGVAYVTGSHQVSKWSLMANASPTKKEIPNTSGEWRSWAAGELAELAETEEDLPGPPKEFKPHPKNPFAKKAERRAQKSGQPIENKSVEDTLLQRPKLLGTQSDSMNDRFPMLPTVKKSSKSNKSSPAASRKTSSSNVSTRKQDEDEGTDLKLKDNGSRLEVEDSPLPRKRSNLALHVMSSSDPDAPVVPPRPRTRAAAEELNATRKAKQEHQLKQQPSLAALLAEEFARDPEMTTASLRRKTRMPAPLHDDKILFRVRRGPYSAQGSSSPEKGGNSSVESFDLLSRKRGTGVGGVAKGTKMGDENSRPSPTKAQIMVDDFLGKRMSKGWREVEEGFGNEQGQGSSPRFL